MPVASLHAPKLSSSLMQSPRTIGNCILGSSSHSSLTHFWLLPLSLWVCHMFLKSQDWRHPLLFSKSATPRPQINLMILILSLLNVCSFFLRYCTWEVRLWHLFSKCLENHSPEMIDNNLNMFFLQDPPKDLNQFIHTSSRAVLIHLFLLFCSFIAVAKFFAFQSSH